MPSDEGAGTTPPGPSFSTTVRVEAVPGPALLVDLTRLVGDTGATVVGVDLVEMASGSARVDVTFHAIDRHHVDRVVEAINSAGHHVRRVSDRAYLYHLGGTIDVVAKSEIRTRDDLSLAYTPAVGRIASSIAAEPAAAWNLTIKANAVAIVTDGTAVLGLGDLGPLAALPVMEGKAALFRRFGEVNAFPLCLDVDGADALVEVVTALAPTFGGVNLEDIAAPRCFEVERRLQERLDIPVFHDDQHGTAAVVLAALLNASRMTGRELRHLRAVVVGIGAAGHAICDILLAAGVEDLVAVDRDGVLRPGPGLPVHQAELLPRLNPRGVRTLSEALVGADALVAVSRRGAIEPAEVAAMADRPIVFGLANPEPEIWPDEAPAGAVVATGRSDLPNQVNNALCFPGVFRGALDGRATRITPAMLTAAATALADTVSEEERQLGVLIPSIFHPRVHERVAAAVRGAIDDADRRTAPPR